MSRFVFVSSEGRAQFQTSRGGVIVGGDDDDDWNMQSRFFLRWNDGLYLPLPNTDGAGVCGGGGAAVLVCGGGGAAVAEMKGNWTN